MNRISMLLVALLLLSCSTACSTGKGAGSEALPDPAAPAALDATVQQGLPAADGMPVLPAPASLERIASEVSDNERVQNGSFSSLQLPDNLFNMGKFSPAWQQPQDGLGQAAYAGYRFYFSEPYTGEARIRLAWKEPLDPADSVYIGFGNHALDRWQWFADSGDGALAGDTADYLSADGALSCCVLVLGNAPCELSYLLLGDNTIPYMNVQTSLDFDKTKNIGPLNVAIDASGSVAYGSQLETFDFDFDGDGTWDVEGNTDGTVLHFYQPGNYTLKVRGTETTGKQATWQDDITIIYENNKPPVAELGCNVTAGLAPQQVELDSTLSSDPDGYIALYEFDIDGDGEYEIERNAATIEDIVISNFGSNTITLRVTDNYFAQDTAEVQVNLLSGWRFSTVDTDVNFGSGAMAVVGADAAARACIAYSDYDTDILEFRVAQNEPALSWGLAREPLAEGLELAISPGLDMAVSPTSGLPIISYIGRVGSGIDDRLYTVLANDEQGVSWNAPVEIPTPDEPGWRTDIEFINTDPAIGFLMGTAASDETKLAYVLAKNPAGSSWNPVQVLAREAFGDLAQDVVLVRSDNGLFNYPLVGGLMDRGSGIYELMTYRSKDVDGTSWEQPDSFGGGEKYQICAAEVDGRPALAIGDYYAGGSMLYDRSLDDKGQEWSGSPQELTSGSDVCMAIWSGKPCIAYVEPVERALYVVRGTDAAGSSWSEPYPVHRTSWVKQPSIAIVNNIPVICYAPVFGDGLFCASWKNF
ncbi:MAG: hypothetical protein H7A35_04240 [Planctomycetales bacterium]|nr:hypothetical protein [bacterium]UNM09266.1 MAG: hypothetical protein H7A35_04240 [Planctomycetales bacterium]